MFSDYKLSTFNAESCRITEHTLKGHSKMDSMEIIAVKISFKSIPEVPIEGSLDYIQR